MSEIKTPTALADLFALHATLDDIHFVKEADNPYFKSKYIDYPSILEKVNPALRKHGFIWDTAISSLNGEPSLKYSLTHKSGEIIRSDEMLLILKSPNPQDQGSAATYAKRYAISSVLNIAADTDDDGNKANDAAKAAAKTAEDAPKGITEQTKGNIYMLLKKLDKDPVVFEKELEVSIGNFTELAGNQLIRKLMTKLEERAATK